MKKVININFQGRVIPIEESAYDILKQYIEALRNFFANEEGRDEIINDIEGRIAELFGETLKKGSTCITDGDVNAVIASIGRPEDFEGEEANVKSQFENKSSQQQSTSSETYTTSAGPKRLFRDENGKIVAGVCSGIANYFGVDPLIIRILFVIFAFGFGFGFITYLVLWVAVPSTSTKVIGSPKKRLLRDSDDKIIAGVCRGLSHYFGVNVWVPRILFLIPFISIIFHWTHWGDISFPHFVDLSFSPGATLLYIILWLVLPEAQTTSDKLEMKGEKVDLNSIKNTVVGDIKDFKERIPQMAQDVKEAIPARAKEFSEITHRSRSGLGNVIALLVKIVVYFIVAVVIFVIVVALFSLGVVGTSLLPVKHYIISDGWQNIYVWGILILFIWIPVIGIIVWIIRRVAKIRSNNNVMRYGFVSLWVVGLFCVFGLIFSLKDDFKFHNYPQEQNVAIPNPGIAKLEVKGITSLKYYGNDTWFHIAPFVNIDEDTAYVRNVQIRIIKSNNDSFKITTLKTANGATRQQAEDLVSRIDYNITQTDSVLFLDRGVAITSKEKFRNQKIYITIAVPVGKRIQIDDNAGGYGTDEHLDFGWDMNDWDWERDYNNNGDFNWDRNTEYIMTKNGLQRTDGNDGHTDNNDDANNDDDNKSSDTSALHYYLKSKEQLQQQIKEKQQEIENMNKQLDQSKDSTIYRYQPAKPAAPATGKKPSAEVIENSNRSMNVSSIVLERFML